MLIEYAGGMRFVARHRGLTVVTDQPAEGGGEDRGMTPAELFLASLAACVGVYVVTFARRHEIAVEGMKVGLDYEITDGPRRVGQIDIKVKLTETLSDEQRTALRRAAESCLVHNTLRHPPVVNIVVDGGDHR